MLLTRETAVERFAQVAVPIPLRRTFTYRIGEDLEGQVAVGAQVEVPLGRRLQPGFVVDFTTTPEVERDKLRAISRVTYPDPVFDERILALARWVADYYVSSLGEVLITALPGGLRSEPRGRRPPRADGRLGLASAPDRLTVAQERVLADIERSLERREFGTFLLFGVTGSGKTEVYLRASQRVVRSGGQVLVLVPEIALSYQVVERFRLAFGDRIGVFHSALTARDRQDTWRAARTGALDVVIGARSAVFTPLPDLRLIVIDEESDGAYKQSDAPRYHAREVAIVRAQQCGATVVLGSATPSLESFANAKRGKYRLLRLPERIDGRPRPSVRSEDLREEEPTGHRAPTIFSPALANQIADRLSRREQVILFLNRRGYSPFVLCRHCGYVARCDQCDVSLTYHRQEDALLCHYCGHRQQTVSECKICGSMLLHFGGVGTQRVEDELQGLFPRARVLRLDFDTTRRVGSYAQILSTFARAEADILLGTQMVAKGLDFPNVTLVGVIFADAGLNLPDFRSAERTFQLLTQVAGRAGRGERPGEVILQTYYPEHYALTTAAAQDFESFFRHEMDARRELAYPPFSRMANLLLDGTHEERVVQSAASLAGHLAAMPDSGHIRFMGPAPQPLSRLKGKHRWHLAMRAERHALLRTACEAALSFWADRKDETRGVRLTVDMDPIELL